MQATYKALLCINYVTSRVVDYDINVRNAESERKLNRQIGSCCHRYINNFLIFFNENVYWQLLYVHNLIMNFRHFSALSFIFQQSISYKFRIERKFVSLFMINSSSYFFYVCNIFKFSVRRDVLHQSKQIISKSYIRWVMSGEAKESF